MEITSEETKLIGKSLFIEGKVVEDDTAKRVNYLTKNYLVKIKTDDTGWDTLFQDPRDSRYWEKVYLQSELHGGGVPSLINISEARAREKYKF